MGWHERGKGMEKRKNGGHEKREREREKEHSENAGIRKWRDPIN